MVTDTSRLASGSFIIFKNVETVLIKGHFWKHFSGVGLENLPKFKNLIIFEKRIDLTGNPKWLNQIEVIRAQKTHFIGLKSFNNLPQLIKMKLAFCGFDNFPYDFDSLKCLNYFQTGAHSFGEIDLSLIDLSRMTCLKFVEFHTWNKNLKGLPKGIDSVEKVKILHSNLTTEQKEILRKSVANKR